MTRSRCIHNVDGFRRTALILPETEEAVDELTALVRDGNLQGQRINDGNIAATMLAAGISTLVTSNGGDFRTFKQIWTITPESALRELEEIEQ